ncbi:MAG: hypothetical protein RL734_2 [Bacteroidota bacterium]
MTPYACVAEYNAIQTWREEVPSSNRVRLSLPPTGNCEFKSSMISHLDFIHLPSIMQQVEILVKYNQLDFVISQLMGHSNTSVTIKSYLGTDTQMMVNEFGRIKDIYSK